MTEPSNDEIDLLDLAIRLIQSLKRHIKLLAAMAILGAGLGFGSAKMAGETYRSQMIIASELVPRAYGGQISVGITSLIKDGNHKSLAEKLALSEMDASQLKELRVSGLVEMVSKQQGRNLIERKEKNFFVITAIVSDPQLLPKLQDGLVYFLLHSPPTEAAVKERAQYYNPLIEKIDEELKDMEAIKQGILEGKTGSSKGQDIILMDPSTLSTEIVHLTEQKLAFQSYMDSSKIVELVEGFAILDKPTKSYTSSYIFTGLLLGLVAGIGFLTLRKLVRLGDR